MCMKPIFEEIKLTENEIRKIDLLIHLEINKLKEIVNNDDLRYKYSNRDIANMYSNIRAYEVIIDKLYGREIVIDEDSYDDCDY